MRWQCLLAMSLLVCGARAAVAQNFGGGPPFILPAQPQGPASPYAASPYPVSPYPVSPYAASPYAASRDTGRVAPASALDFQPLGVRRIDPMLAAPMGPLPANWNGANWNGANWNGTTLQYIADDEQDGCGIGPISAPASGQMVSGQMVSGPMAAPLAPSGRVVYRPVTPALPQPPAFVPAPAVPTRSFMPSTMPVPRQATLGKGLLGQPKVYIAGQPIRNFVRFLTP